MNNARPCIAAFVGSTREQTHYALSIAVAARLYAWRDPIRLQNTALTSKLL